MSYQKKRDEFIARATREGLTVEVARTLLREASTMQCLAVAMCNGDWPCDNGERKTALCGRCGLGYVPSVLKGKDRLCPDCRAEDRVRKVLEPFAGFAPDFSGDPRGCVLKLKTPSGRGDDFGTGTLLCVPTRDY